MKRLAAAVLLTASACTPQPTPPVASPTTTTTTTKPHRESVTEPIDPTAGLEVAVTAAPRTTAPRAARSRPRTRVATVRPTVRPAAPRVSRGSLPPNSIKNCESGGNYSAENRRSSASGAWQITDGSWSGYAGYRHAADAPASVQDERAAQLWNGGRGASNWKACR